jgi:hypothetical protein
MEDHLYVDDSGAYGWAANSWESAVLEAEMERADLLAGCAISRASRGLSVFHFSTKGRQGTLSGPCHLRRERQASSRPARSSQSGLPDAVAKAVGLAKIASKHGDFFDELNLSDLPRTRSSVWTLTKSRCAIRCFQSRIRATWRHCLQLRLTIPRADSVRPLQVAACTLRACIRKLL